MLIEAEIEIVDDHGHVEDRVRIMGGGEVALTTNGKPWLQLVSEDSADTSVIIALRNGTVTVEAEQPQALRVDNAFCPWRSHTRSSTNSSRRPPLRGVPSA